MNEFDAFDPLKAKGNAESDVAALAQKREINNILSSYVGWYDPFCELIQNSLDSVELRLNSEPENYTPLIWVTINILDNSLIVTDNGVGLKEDEFKQFLCPDISFKSGDTRGHKGVGATYLAYGFNFIQVATKTLDFYAIGKMEDARKWLSDQNPSGNPKIKPDKSGSKDPVFESIDRGVSIYLKFDKQTHPKDLKWIVASTAESWEKILSIKTGIGAFIENQNIKINIKVIDRDGKETNVTKEGTSYFLAHKHVSKSASVVELKTKELELFQKKGSNFNMPSKLKNLDAIYQKWNSNEILELEKANEIKLTEEEKELLTSHSPRLYIVYVYSLKIWEAINKSLNIRNGQSLAYGGIQIGANNMPQGETIQIPLNRNIGRQNQIHVFIHFDNCSPDLGRKGFQSEFVEFSKELSKKLADGPLLKIKKYLKPNTGSTPNLSREAKVEDWKREMEDHETSKPLYIKNPNFFLPSREIAITSIPTREQDVVALFNQLLAGGVIRGIRVMSTNERLTYDGLVRVVIDPPKEHHLYNEETNPLGIEENNFQGITLPFKSTPKILEYKFSLDGLIEDIENGNKNSNDVSIVVCWETGKEYEQNYSITSLLNPDNLSLREYHGITHIMTNISTGQKEMDLIVLNELIEYLNFPDQAIAFQEEKYE